jgi:vancomycin resistance protein VanJ
LRPSWLLWITGIYAAVLVALTVLNWLGADRFWLGALNLYLPQAMWAVPGGVLAFLLFRTERGLAWLPMLGVLWVLGPVMGCKLALPQLRAAPPERRLRVMTWNIKYGSYRIAPLIQEVARHNPDLIFFQDAVGSMDGPLGAYLGGWQVRAVGQYVIASRYPLEEAELRELPSFGHGGESYLHCRMRLGAALVSLYNVHLKTPRRSLNGFRAARKVPWYLPEAIDSFDRNITTRLLQAVTLRGDLSREPGPVLLAGDLNSPDGSLACATLREAGLHDAFSEGGTGYGFSYGQMLFKHRLPWLRLAWMRIDHVMLTEGFEALRCWTGTGSASDHRPVLADVALRLR